MKRTKAPMVRVLIIDDFEPWRDWVRSKLADTRFQVYGEAADGLNGLEKARQLKPDIILLDIGLPDISGIELAEQIDRLQLNCKVIFVTQNIDLETKHAALATGAIAYVTKMCAATDLLPALEAAVNGD